MAKINKDKLVFKNLGVEPTHPDISQEIPVVIKPRIHLTDKQISELKDKKIGDKCHLYVIAEVKGMHESREFEPGDDVHVELELQQAAYVATESDGETTYAEAYEG